MKNMNRSIKKKEIEKVDYVHFKIQTQKTNKYKYIFYSFYSKNIIKKCLFK